MTVVYEEIIYAIDGPVATITMNRPDQLNALTDLTQAEIRHALDQSERNSDVVGTVLTGGGRGFCAGVERARICGPFLREATRSKCSRKGASEAGRGCPWSQPR